MTRVRAEAVRNTKNAAEHKDTFLSNLIVLPYSIENNKKIRY